jgi:hypothetical protein
VGWGGVRRRRRRRRRKDAGMWDGLSKAKAWQARIQHGQARTVDGDECQVVDEDDEADGEGDERGHVRVLHAAGRVRAEEDGQHQEQRAEHLPEEGLCRSVGRVFVFALC